MLPGCILIIVGFDHVEVASAPHPHAAVVMEHGNKYHPIRSPHARYLKLEFSIAFPSCSYAVYAEPVIYHVLMVLTC